MPLILAKIVVKCPVEGTNVYVHEKCVECAHFRHLGLRGAKVYISCEKAPLK